MSEGRSCWWLAAYVGVGWRGALAALAVVALAARARGGSVPEPAAGDRAAARPGGARRARRRPPPRRDSLAADTRGRRPPARRLLRLPRPLPRRRGRLCPVDGGARRRRVDRSRSRGRLAAASGVAPDDRRARHSGHRAALARGLSGLPARSGARAQARSARGARPAQLGLVRHPEGVALRRAAGPERCRGRGRRPRRNRGRSGPAAARTPGGRRRNRGHDVGAAAAPRWRCWR